MSSDKKSGVAYGWLLFGGSALGIFALGMLASNITSRKEEAKVARVQFNTEISDWEADNSKWGESFPREYASWKAAEHMNQNSKYGGSGARDYLEDNPRLVILFAGYGFSKEFKQARGHFYAVEDVVETARTGDASPATCWTCKSPDVPRLMDETSPSEFYADNFMNLKDEVTNPIGCADCHDNETMALRISRPALKEAYERQGKDITEATHQEMRSLVCAQCHVEYYFKGKEEKYLTFPWDDGLTVENFETYFEKTGHVDWINAVSGAKMIKMQHPDFEMYEQGIHAFQGVSCSDCHMPYKSEGGIKFTDHQVQSPLYNIQNSCQVCHKWSETEVKDRVTKIQDNNREMLDRAENSLVRAHMEVGNLSKLGVTDAELEEARRLITVSQLYWDYVAANNGMGFHAPQESARILTKSIDFSKDCLIITATLRATKGLPAFEMPDVTSQEKAKGFITPLVDAQKAAKAAAAKTASVPAEQTTASIVSDDKA